MKHLTAIETQNTRIRELKAQVATAVAKLPRTMMIMDVRWVPDNRETRRAIAIGELVLLHKSNPIMRPHSRPTA